MPHIHTGSGQHDITTSAWIMMRDEHDVRVLVHMHRKNGKLMPVGGHIELDETPWQTLIHEIKEESGYDVADLEILQPYAEVPAISGATVHPVPVVSNTHKVSDTHFHSDYCYAFIAHGKPHDLPSEGESTDLRWLTLSELDAAVENNDALRDVADIYRHMVEKVMTEFHPVSTVLYAQDKPSSSLLHE